MKIRALWDGWATARGGSTVWSNVPEVTDVSCRDWIAEVCQRRSVDCGVESRDGVGKLKMNMARIINAKQLRAELSDIARRAQRGERFTVLYRSRPAFQIVPIDEEGALDRVPLSSDPLYEAPPVGRSTDGLTSRDHDQVLYGTTKT